MLQPMTDYQEVEDAFRRGKIDECGEDQLRSYLVLLSNQVVNNDSVKHREVIRGLTINHILLQRHISRLDADNSRLGKIVIWLTVVSTIASIVQVVVALK